MLYHSAQDATATSHLYALSISNLKHGFNSALILVRLTASVLQWAPLVECLMAVVFPDAFVAIHSEDTYAKWLKDYPPDFVFASVEDLIEESASAEASMDSRVYASHLPSTARLVLLPSNGVSTRLLLAPLETHHERAILMSPIADPPACFAQHHLFLPAASSSFAHRIHHSPRDLLHPSMMGHERSFTSALVGVCGCNQLITTDSSTLRGEFVINLQALGISSSIQCWTTGEETQPVFHHDAEVERCHQYKFAVAFEDHPDAPGYIGHHIVSAFLAGSIPIYYGHSPTVSWLFNPKAFIDCRTFDSMSDCAAHVARVHASADLYEAMRREPPVVNHTAFREVFSWHPDATTESTQGHTLGKRFRELLMNV